MHSDIVRNGEILVSGLNSRASVLRRSSSTCATRTLNRQGCKPASGTRKPHHQSFSNFDALHRQPVHLYNGSPGLQRQLLKPIREVRTHPTPSQHTDAAQLWNGKPSFAIAAGALVFPLQNHNHSLYSLGHFSSVASPVRPLAAVGLDLACSQWENDDETCLSAAKLVGALPLAKALPLSSPRHLHFFTAFHPIGIFTAVNLFGRIPSGKTVTDFPFFHTCGGYLSLDTFPLPSAQLALLRRSIRVLRSPSGKSATRLILCPILVRKFPPAMHTFPPTRAVL